VGAVIRWQLAVGQYGSLAVLPLPILALFFAIVALFVAIIAQNGPRSKEEGGQLNAAPGLLAFCHRSCFIQVVVLFLLIELIVLQVIVCQDQVKAL